MAIVRAVLFAFGYPAAIVVILRFVPVVREQRTRWIVVHHLGVAAIVIGWATLPRWSAVIINGSWLVSSTIWYGLGGRRRAARTTPSAEAG